MIYFRFFIINHFANDCAHECLKNGFVCCGLDVKESGILAVKVFEDNKPPVNYEITFYKHLRNGAASENILQAISPYNFCIAYGDIGLVLSFSSIGTLVVLP